MKISDIEDKIREEYLKEVMRDYTDPRNVEWRNSLRALAEDDASELESFIHQGGRGRYRHRAELRLACLRIGSGKERRAPSVPHRQAVRLQVLLRLRLAPSGEIHKIQGEFREHNRPSGA